MMKGLAFALGVVERILDRLMERSKGERFT